VASKLAKLPATAWLTEAERDTQPPLSEDKVKELALLRLHEADSILNRAYAADAPPLPGAFSHVVQYVVAWGELFGGVALLIGLLTRLAALGQIVIQLGAIWFVTGTRGLFTPGGVGAEYNLALLAMCLAVFILGGGGWSVDRFLHWRRVARAQQPTAAVPQQAPVAS
jgi:uncharacterized membrane protein YphA (DoxX/SURF4 family)